MDQKKDELDHLHFCEKSNESNNICNTQWLTLYTTAAYLPEVFGEEDKRLSRNFFSSFYDQCKDPIIGGDIDRMKDSIKTESRRELMISLCTIENMSRQKAGLPLRQCRYNKLMERWRYPDGYL